MTACRATLPAIEFERNQLLKGDEARHTRHFLGSGKRDLATTLKDSVSRQQINQDAVSAVAQTTWLFGNPLEWTSQIGCDELVGFEHVRNDDVHIDSDPIISMFLDREAANDPMRNVQVGKSLDGAAERFGDMVRAGGLTQQICTRTAHAWYLAWISGEGQHGPVRIGRLHSTHCSLISRL